MSKNAVSFRVPAGLGAKEIHARVGRYLAALSTKGSYLVEISDYKPKRSLSQNRFLWGVIYPAILAGGGEALGGWTAPDLHEYLLGECFGWEMTEAFGRKRMRPVRRSSVLNKQEFTDFLDFIRSHMLEHGINLPEGST